MVESGLGRMLEVVESLPEQIEESEEIVSDVSVPRADFDSIAVLGMGGSAIGGDILADYLYGTCATPICVVRRSYLPAHITSSTLVLAVSYSGNTSETLACAREAIGQGCQVVGLSSGGNLEELCDRFGLPHIKVPAGLPPRGAIGYLFAPLALLLDDMGICETREELVGVVRHLKSSLSGLKDGEGLPRRIARAAERRIPVIYAVQPYLSVARRWHTQFNENGKILSWFGELPEIAHNEVEGWAGDKWADDHVVLLLKDGIDGEMEKRVEAVSRLFGNLLTVLAEGESLLERVFHLLWIGDFASCYIAELRGVNPLPVETIEQIKRQVEG